MCSGSSSSCCSAPKWCPPLRDLTDCSTPGSPVLHCLLESAPLSSTVSWSLLKPMSTESVMPSNHLILCHPLLLPSIFPSIRVFSSESILRIRWPKYWSFSFSICPSNEQSGLISFRMDWLDLLAVQGTLKNLLQHHSSKARSKHLLFDGREGGFHIYKTTQEMCIKYYYPGTSERSQSRGCGGRPVPISLNPLESCLVTSIRFHEISQRKRTAR